MNKEESIKDLLWVPGPLDGLGGSEYLAVTLAGLLADVGIRVRILTGTEPRQAWLDRISVFSSDGRGIEVRRAPSSSARDVCNEICRWLDEKSADVLQIMPLGDVAMMWLQTRPREVPTIVLEPTDLSGRCWWLPAEALDWIHRLDAFFVLNPEGKREAVERLRYRGPVFVIPVTCEAGRKNTYTPAPNSIGCISRLSPEKGLEYLWSAFRIYREHYPQARLAVWGDGPEKQRLRELSIMLEIDNALDLKGSFDPFVDIDKICAESEIFVLSSLFEGAPVALLELAARARAVVATATAGAVHVLGGSYPYLVPVAQPESMARALVYLTAHPEERNKAGEIIAERFQSNFQAPSVIAALLNAYRKVISDSTGCRVTQ